MIARQSNDRKTIITKLLRNLRDAQKDAQEYGILILEDSNTCMDGKMQMDSNMYMIMYMIGN